MTGWAVLSVTAALLMVGVDSNSDIVFAVFMPGNNRFWRLNITFDITMFQLFEDCVCDNNQRTCSFTLSYDWFDTYKATAHHSHSLISAVEYSTVFKCVLTLLRNLRCERYRKSEISSFSTAPGYYSSKSFCFSSCGSLLWQEDVRLYNSPQSAPFVTKGICDLQPTTTQTSLGTTTITPTSTTTSIDYDGHTTGVSSSPINSTYPLISNHHSITGASTDSTNSTKSSNEDIPLIAGVTSAAAIIIVLVIVVIFLLHRKRKFPFKKSNNSKKIKVSFHANKPTDSRVSENIYSVINDDERKSGQIEENKMNTLNHIASSSIPNYQPQPVHDINYNLSNVYENQIPEYCANNIGIREDGSSAPYSLAQNEMTTSSSNSCETFSMSRQANSPSPPRNPIQNIQEGGLLYEKTKVQIMNNSVSFGSQVDEPISFPNKDSTIYSLADSTDGNSKTDDPTTSQSDDSAFYTFTGSTEDKGSAVYSLASSTDGKAKTENIPISQSNGSAFYCLAVSSQGKTESSSCPPADQTDAEAKPEENSPANSNESTVYTQVKKDHYSLAQPVPDHIDAGKRTQSLQDNGSHYQQPKNQAVPGTEAKQMDPTYQSPSEENPYSVPKAIVHNFYAVGDLDRESLLIYGMAKFQNDYEGYSVPLETSDDLSVNTTNTQGQEHLEVNNENSDSGYQNVK